METYSPPFCCVLTILPEQGLLNASNESYPVDQVDPGFV